MPTLSPNDLAKDHKLAGSYRISIAKSMGVALRNLRGEDDNSDEGRESDRASIRRLVENHRYRIERFFAFPGTYIGPDPIFSLNQPPLMKECNDLCEALWQRYLDVERIPIRRLSMLIADERGGEFLDTGVRVPDAETVTRVLREAEEENLLGIKRARHATDGVGHLYLGKTRDHRALQCFNWLWAACQFAILHHEHPEVTRLWQYPVTAPTALVPHAEYSREGKRVAVVYGGNLAPKSIALLADRLLQEYQRIEFY